VNTRHQVIAPVVVAFFSLCLYLFCLAPSVTTAGDSGELIAASYRLGIAHPSGYPLYCIVGKIFATIFPFGEIAWRYNLFSALCGAATCGLVALIVLHLLPIQTDSPSAVRLQAACGAGFLLAGFIFFGAQSLIAEVYAPTGLMAALAFLCALNFARTAHLKWLAVLAATLGLSLNLHLSMVFLLPGILVFLVLPKRAQASSKPGEVSTPSPRISWLQAAPVFAFYFLAGFAVTLYLPLRAATFPAPIEENIGGQNYLWGQTLDWGHPVDFQRWKAHVLVQQYKSLLFEPFQVSVFGREMTLRRFAQSPAGAWQQLLSLANSLILQFLWTLPLIFIGALQMWRKGSTPSRAFSALLTVTFLANVLCAIHYRVDNVFDIMNFLFPAYVAMAIWMGLGIAWLFEGAAKWGQKLDGAADFTGGWRWRLSTLAKLLIIGAIVAQWTFFVMAASWKGNTRARDGALLRAQAAETLQRQSARAPTLFLIGDDSLFPFWYLQKVLGKAKDARTPWGAAMHAYEDQKKLPVLAGKLLKSGPVATAQWRADVDAKFPYAPLTKTGNLWQLTNGVLPLAARPTGEAAIAKPGVVRAKFLQQEIKKSELVGFEIDFALPVFASQRRPPIDRKNQTTQIGFVEILVAPRALALRPAPTQSATFSGKTPQVWKDARRLVVPIKARRGEILRATLPWEFPTKFTQGDYDVWARVVPLIRQGEIGWKKVDGMRMVVR